MEPVQLRREFLKKWLGLSLSIPVAGLLASCGQSAPTAAPTQAPAAPAATKPPAATVAPAATKPPAAAAAPATPAVSSGSLPVGLDKRFTKKYAGTKLRAMLSDLADSHAAKARIGEFEALTGISVEIEIPPYDAQIQKALLDLSGSSTTFDVLTMDVPWFPQYKATKNILRLDDLIAKEDPSYKSEFVPELLQIVNRAATDGIYAIPTSNMAQVMCYRKDLFEQQAANFKSATGKDLAPATTWREFADQAKFFTKKLNPNSPTEFGVAMNGTRGNGTLNVFTVILWGMGGREFDQKYNVTLNDEKAMPAWELLAELGQYSQSDVGAHNWDEMNTVYKSGKSALQYQWPVFMAGNEKPESPTQGKTGYAQLPGGQSNIGGYATTINKKSANTEAAWEFIRWLTGPEMAKVMLTEGGAQVRLPIFNDPELNKNFTYLQATLGSNKLVNNRASACRECPDLVPEAQYELKTGTEASAVLTGAKSPKQGADDAARALNEILKDFGYK